MKFLFLGDIIGFPGCDKLKKNLPEIIIKKKIDFVVVNGENSFDSGVGITENVMSELLSSGVDVITTGNHVWDQKETYDFIKNEKRLLRPLNLIGDLPGEGFNIYNSKKGFKVGVLNLMGNVFMKKCENVFDVSKNFLDNKKLKADYDFLLVDFVTNSHIPFSLFAFITFVFVRITALLFFASNALSITSLASSTLQSEYSKPTLNFSFNGFCTLVLLSLIFFEGAKYFLLAI